MKRIIFLILLLSLSLSCKNSTDSPENANHAPIVHDIILNPPSPLLLPLSGEEVATEMSAIATDADGDILSYGAWLETIG